MLPIMGSPGWDAEPFAGGAAGGAPGGVDFLGAGLPCLMVPGGLLGVEPGG
jgi:hypothetical protein